MKKYHCYNCKKVEGYIHSVSVTIGAFDFIAHCCCSECDHWFNMEIKAKGEEGEEILRRFGKLTKEKNPAQG